MAEYLRRHVEEAPAHTAQRLPAVGVTRQEALSVERLLDHGSYDQIMSECAGRMQRLRERDGRSEFSLWWSVVAVLFIAPGLRMNLLHVYMDGARRPGRCWRGW